VASALANISQVLVLGHDSIETTLHVYIHASANAEQRLGAMMNARWTSQAHPGPQRNLASADDLGYAEGVPSRRKGVPQ
jgi:hypothetical protein